jgi:hypothetical protein
MQSHHLTSRDVGNPAIAGTTQPLTTGYRLHAGGADIWRLRDEFHFAALEQTGDFDATVRVASLTLSHPFAKAGLMVRDSLAENAAMFFHFVFPDNRERGKNTGGHESHVRTLAGENCSAIYPAAGPVNPPPFPVTWPNTWLRVTRRGARFEAFASPDGSVWQRFGGAEVALPDTVWLGLGLCSHDKAIACTAEFFDFSIAPSASV